MSSVQQTSQQAMKDVYFKLKVHHLSHFLISLFKLNDLPFSMQIEYVMENYLDTPKEDIQTTRAKHVSLINMTRIKDNNVRIIKCNTFTIGNNPDVNQTNSCTNDIDSFDTNYAILAFNVRRILNLNRQYEDCKRTAKSARNRIQARQDFKAQKRAIEKDKSECKRNIRDVMLEIYNR